VGTPPARGPPRRARIEIVSHADLARLHPTGRHPESTERLTILLESLGTWQEHPPATSADLERCHDAGYVERIRAVSAPTLLDLDTVCSETTYRAGLLAAGATIAAATRNAFAIVRPPGHHALHDRGMGFCIFNNVAVAARRAQAETDLERIAIVDWDVHHGNGTQAIFWDDPSVLYVSLHQWPFYPGTGGPDEQNETTVNVPLRAGAGDAVYALAWRETVEPAVRRFDPDLVLVSAGFDAHSEDPLAGMAVSEAGFRELARRSAALAPRVAAVLEGGYNLETLPRLVAAALTGFSEEQAAGS
jgi:acetoin utilization deacetylase AcuC-like enzyme